MIESLKRGEFSRGSTVLIASASTLALKVALIENGGNIRNLDVEKTLWTKFMERFLDERVPDEGRFLFSMNLIERKRGRQFCFLDRELKRSGAGCPDLSIAGTILRGWPWVGEKKAMSSRGMKSQ